MNHHAPLLIVLLGVLVGVNHVLAQQPKRASALQTLIETERAFARTSVQKGSRAAFLEFFADDGLVFRPHPAVYKDVMKKVPPPTNPLAATLKWEPSFADVSEAGDLGYTTGPYTLTDNSLEHRPTQHGYFFTIWKRKGDGRWKVVLDLGIRVPRPSGGPGGLHTATAVVRRVPVVKKRIEEELNTLKAVDAAFAERAKVDGEERAYSACLSADARLYRQGLQTFVGIDSVRAFLKRHRICRSWEPISAGIAQSADLGFTYGSYESRGADPQAPGSEKGYYVRMWKRDAENQWKVVFDITSPVPPEPAKQ